MSNGKGFRQAPQLSAKDKFREVNAQLTNVQMASRIQQMMTQKLLENGKAMGEDIGRLFQLVNETQYKVLALQELLNVDSDALTKLVEAKRLKDFDEASAKEDEKEGLLAADVVEEDSTVYLTSTTANPDAGIFRSRLKLAESGVPDLIKGLMGKGVGEKVKVQLNGAEHEVELLAIRKPKPAPELKAVGNEESAEAAESAE